MNAQAMTMRNLTADGEPFAPAETRSGIPWSVPDALIHALSRYRSELLFEYGDVREHFVAAGYTDADLVLGGETHGGSGFGWMLQVLQWDPKAAAGEPGHWTWAPPQPTISDRLRVALYVLSIKRETVDGVFCPGAHAMAQRGLNEVLLAYPVLLHPRVRVHFGLSLGISAGTCSVAHAVAMTPEAHFPMASDWPAGQAPMNALREFANATVVRRVLCASIRSIRHRDELASAVGRSYFAAAIKMSPARPGLLRSLHELGRLMNPESGRRSAAGCILEDWNAIHGPEAGANKPGVYARSLIAACGVMRGRQSREQAARYRDESFLASVGGALGSDREQALLRFALQCFVFEAVFGNNDAAAYSADEVAYNLQALTSGLAKSGAFETEVVVAKWIVEQLKVVGVPAVEPAAALGFIRTLRGFDVELQQSDFDSDTRGADETLDAFAPGWATAIRIDAAERAMLEVLGRTREPAASYPDCVLTSRRRRASV